MMDEEAIKILSHTTNLGYGVVIETMEGYTTRDIKIALDMAIEALGVRPQGEWIPKHLGYKTHVWVCSECGNQNIHGITVEKACWKCGADMRKPNYLKKQLVGNSDRLEKREEE